MKIAFYFENLGNNRVIDARNPELGNMGIGGTPYSMLLLAYYLAKEKKDWQVYCIAENDMLLNENLNLIKIKKENLLQTIQNLNIDILLVPNDRFNEFISLKLPKDLKIITRSGNEAELKELLWLEKCNNIKANVFVGKQMYDLYIDSDLIKKSKYIFNFRTNISVNLDRNLDEQIVVYMGTLIKCKGFHVLAKMWKSILKECPNAKLWVFGSADVYGYYVTFGSLGIASKEYEEEFLSYLKDENGILLPSVKFFGKVGSEKYEYFTKCSVGVANPTALSETFCSTVIEMNNSGLPVVTINKNSFPDVIKHNKTGLLGENEKEIKKYIIKLLKDDDLNLILGNNARKWTENFLPEKIIPQWIELFEQVKNDAFAHKIQKANKPYKNRHKYLRIINNFLRFKMKLKFLPSLILIELLFDKYKGKLKKIIKIFFFLLVLLFLFFHFYLNQINN